MGSAEVGGCQSLLLASAECSVGCGGEEGRCVGCGGEEGRCVGCGREEGRCVLDWKDLSLGW